MSSLLVSLTLVVALNMSPQPQTQVQQQQQQGSADGPALPSTSAPCYGIWSRTPWPWAGDGSIYYYITTAFL
jgi:hypothetical protein